MTHLNEKESHWISWDMCKNRLNKICKCWYFWNLKIPKNETKDGINCKIELFSPKPRSVFDKKGIFKSLRFSVIHFTKFLENDIFDEIIYCDIQEKVKVKIKEYFAGITVFRIYLLSMESFDNCNMYLRINKSCKKICLSISENLRRYLVGLFAKEIVNFFQFDQYQEFHNNFTNLNNSFINKWNVLKVGERLCYKIIQLYKNERFMLMLKQFCKETYFKSYFESGEEIDVVIYFCYKNSEFVEIVMDEFVVRDLDDLGKILGEFVLLKNKVIKKLSRKQLIIK
jgi:hypothetical protein